jgi:hypothetical protein
MVEGPAHKDERTNEEVLDNSTNGENSNSSDNLYEEGRSNSSEHNNKNQDQIFVQTGLPTNDQLFQQLNDNSSTSYLIGAGLTAGGASLGYAIYRMYQALDSDTKPSVVNNSDEILSTEINNDAYLLKPIQDTQPLNLQLPDSPGVTWTAKGEISEHNLVVLKNENYSHGLTFHGELPPEGFNPKQGEYGNYLPFQIGKTTYYLNKDSHKVYSYFEFGNMQAWTEVPSLRAISRAQFVFNNGSVNNEYLNALKQAGYINYDKRTDAYEFNDHPTITDIYNNTTIREPFTTKFSWAVPTPEALSAIAEFAKGEGIVEIGAGTGYWASLLQQGGVSVDPYDRTPVETGENTYHPPKGESGSTNQLDKPTSWTQVKQGSVEAIAPNASKTLLLCWPPCLDSMAAQALKAYNEAGGQQLIYIGDLPDRAFDGVLGHSVTADREFHQMLHDSWQVERTIDIPQWYAGTEQMQDKVYLLTRKDTSSQMPQTITEIPPQSLITDSLPEIEIIESPPNVERNIELARQSVLSDGKPVVPTENKRAIEEKPKAESEAKGRRINASGKGMMFLLLASAAMRFWRNEEDQMQQNDLSDNLKFSD